MEYDFSHYQTQNACFFRCCDTDADPLDVCLSCTETYSCEESPYYAYEHDSDFYRYEAEKREQILKEEFFDV